MSLRDRRVVQTTEVGWRPAYARRPASESEAATRHLHELLASPPGDRDHALVA